MKTGWLIAITTCGLVGARVTLAQAPLPAPGQRAAEVTVGNQVLQARYLDSSPLSGVNSNLDYGLLLTENREFVASTAWMFDAQIPLSRLRVQVGPQAYLAWLAAGTKTDVFALALGANIRYELISSVGLAIFGSGFYSPGVLTFGSAHNLYDFTAGAEIRLFDRLYAQAGYRWFKYTLVDLPDEKLVNEVFGGVRWQLH
jgi:hypothetical protein